jgi:hypothetical protein
MDKHFFQNVIIHKLNEANKGGTFVRFSFTGEEFYKDFLSSPVNKEEVVYVKKLDPRPPKNTPFMVEMIFKFSPIVSINPLFWKQFFHTVTPSLKIRKNPL